MNIKELKKLYHDGKITKSEFISKAFQVHKTLFEYVNIIKESDIQEIKITSDDINFLIGEENILLSSPLDEARVAPIEIMNFEKYEPGETQIMDLVVEGCRCIVDIGSNIGWYTVRFAVKNPKAKIYSFEPIPKIYSYLQRNISMNGVGSNVFTFNFGLSEKSEKVEFFISPQNCVNASLKDLSNTGDAKKISSFTQTLDIWGKNFQITPDFLKCDVEGAELLVFKGGRNLISSSRPIIFTEMLRKWSKSFNYHPNDMIEFFKSLGYECFGIFDSNVRKINIVTEETVETNYLFMHTEKHSDKINLVKQNV